MAHASHPDTSIRPKGEVKSRENACLGFPTSSVHLHSKGSLPVGSISLVNPLPVLRSHSRSSWPFPEAEAEDFAFQFYPVDPLPGPAKRAGAQLPFPISIVLPESKVHLAARRGSTPPHSPPSPSRRPLTASTAATMNRDHFLRLLDLHADDDPFFPSFPFPTSSCPFSSSAHHRFLLDDHPSCPLGFTSPSPIDTFHLDLDLLLPRSAAAPTPPCPAFFDPFLLDDLGHRVSALERALAPPPPAPRRKYTYAAESGGRKLKWVAEDKPAGGRNYKWEAEIKTPNDDGFDRKWKWESKASAAGTTKVKWAKEIKGKGFLEPWSNSYSLEETYGDDDQDQDKDNKPAAAATAKKVKEGKDKKKNKGNVEIVEIEDNTAGCVAIRKAFEMNHAKGKKKELSPQDAALLIQMSYRAHLAHRSQVLRCLRDLAVAKAKLKEIRSFFYNISYRRRIAHDSEERQRFAEKIIVLLLTVDALEGPDYMVRNAKRSMLEELEGMLEIVDPQPPGKPRTLSRRKFDLPEGGAIPKEMRDGVKNVVRIVEEGK